MKDEEIIQKLKDILKNLNNKDIDNLNMESSLSTDLGLDSVGLVYMAVIIEESFNCDMTHASVSDFIKIKDVVKYIKENKK